MKPKINVKKNPPDPLQGRFDRLRAKLLHSSKPIHWLRALPGSGKTRFLLTLKTRGDPSRFAEWLTIDERSADAGQAPYP